MIKAIILDMDDTLVETGKFGLETFEKHLIKHNCKYTQEEVKSIFNKGYTEVFKKILKRNKIHFKESMLDEMRADYSKMISKAKLMPYAKELLEAIHDKAIMILATFSLKAQADIAIENNDLRKYFDKIVCADSSIFSHKKFQLKYILDEFKLKPEECILVEDSHYGIESGMHNKIFTIGVSHYYDDLKADIVVNDLHAAKTIILEKLSNGG